MKFVSSDVDADTVNSTVTKEETLAEKKQKLNELDASIAMLNDDKARRKALLSEIKSQEKRSRLAQHPRLIVFLGIASILLLISTTAFGILYYRSQQALASSISALSDQRKVSDNDANYANLINKYDQLYDKYTQLNTDYDNLNSQYKDASVCQQFLMNRIGFVIEGSNYYYTYGNAALLKNVSENSNLGNYIASHQVNSNESLWQSYKAYTVEQCEALGYKKFP